MAVFLTIPSWVETIHHLWRWLIEILDALALTLVIHGTRCLNNMLVLSINHIKLVHLRLQLSLHLRQVVEILRA